MIPILDIQISAPRKWQTNKNSTKFLQFLQDEVEKDGREEPGEKEEEIYSSTPSIAVRSPSVSGTAPPVVEPQPSAMKGSSESLGKFSLDRPRFPEFLSDLRGILGDLETLMF